VAIGAPLVPQQRIHDHYKRRERCPAALVAQHLSEHGVDTLAAATRQHVAPVCDTLDE
jgi:hypothetical protein